MTKPFTFDADERKKIGLTVEVANTVPTDGVTVQVEIDDVRYDCEWADDLDEGDTTWTRTAQTEGWFAGPSVPTDDVAGAVVLASGIHYPKLLVQAGPVVAALDIPPFVIT